MALFTSPALPNTSAVLLQGKPGGFEALSCVESTCKHPAAARWLPVLAAAPVFEVHSQDAFQSDSNNLEE